MACANMCSVSPRGVRLPLCTSRGGNGESSQKRGCSIAESSPSTVHTSFKFLVRDSAAPGHESFSARRRARKERWARRTAVGDDTPWKISLYHSKRKTHRTGKLGEILKGDDGEEECMELPMWTADMQRRLAIKSIAQELGETEEFVDGRMEELEEILPDLKEKVKFLKVADVARLAVNVGDTAMAVVRMKNIFPRTDISRMCSRMPTLLMEEPTALENSKAKLQELLPNADIDKLVEDNPHMLRVDSVEKALKELAILMPEKDVAMMLTKNPSLLYTVQRAEDIIPYDNGSLIQIQESMRMGG
mmetsp:Transcript_42075/g.51022  ORF Transcript_42075/g.51022 Transcript_42075/m.51022 type:complete len:304 (+) Transcript_42075:233-1144(+)|eukprot:CAMPEP_0197848276 /NCGR_PEP_ID=MMETSP1438-20131217/8125_1 /TAXON_ID=1461541 /ORGANISM="Pterosperma sp., Strain CCMP1384" /LENGTH=303 /DNA_ID=CAMNT_0043460435 /DNA_START=231 /DNA_END=1139 /DNA_ORIENTATION=+